MKNVFYILMLLLPNILLGQATNNSLSDIKYLDIIKTKRGDVFQGKIIELGEQVIVIEILGGYKFHLTRDEIKTIRQRCLNCNDFEAKKILAYNFREEGLYNQLSIGLSSSDYAPGYSLSYSLGKLYKRYFGIGGGTGIYSFADNNGIRWNLVPIFAEARSYTVAKRVSPVLSAKVGYGINLKHPSPDWYRVTENQKGGFFFNPALGFRLGANPDLNMVVNLGFLVQHIKEEYRLDATNLGTEWRKQIFRRWTLELGVLF
jgi:hypothetical protein